MTGVGELVLLGIEGTSLNAGEQEALAVFGVSGVILFARNCPTPAAVAALTAEVQAAATAGGRSDDLPVLVAVDQEGGPVRRLRRGFPSFPGAAELGRRGDRRETAAVAGELARRLRSLGINLNLAPVGDLQRPESQVLAERCFAAAPATVSRLATAFITGLQAGGVAACIKHFPGHGAVAADSHRELPTARISREELTASHLQPFAAAVAAGVRVMMPGHLYFPAVDADRPVTFSPLFLQGIARRQLGFSGVLLSDDLDMEAVGGASLAAVMWRSLSAGMDLVLWGRNLKKGDDPRQVLNELEKTARRGSEEDWLRLAAKKARLRELRSWLAARPGPETTAAGRPREIDC